jgi:hypothetical protein
MGMLPVYLAAPALILFVAGVLRDPRSFSNAVFLGLGLALGALGAAHRLADTSGPAARLVSLALGLLVGILLAERDAPGVRRRVPQLQSGQLRHLRADRRAALGPLRGHEMKGPRSHINLAIGCQ